MSPLSFPVLLNAKDDPKSNPPGDFDLSQLAVGDRVQLVALVSAEGIMKEVLGSVVRDPFWVRITRIVSRDIDASPVQHHLDGSPDVLHGTVEEGCCHAAIEDGMTIAFHRTNVVEIA